MTNSQYPVLQAAAPEYQVEAVETSLQKPVRVGLIIAFVVFGVFGVWSAIAPISGAALGVGIVTVKSYKKTVQHLEGGIVKEILVRNGDLVSAGEPLLILDSTQPLAQLEIINSQFAAFKALEARLIAERDNLASVNFPLILQDPSLDAAMEVEAQSHIFMARKATREGGIEVLQQRIEQLQSRAEGLRALKSSKEELAASYGEELIEVRDLLSQGFSDKLRSRDLERNLAILRGDAAELTASISATEMQIGETRLEILQQDKEFLNEVVNDLAEVQTRLKDINERSIALRDIVDRIVIRAPEAGIVLGMQVHTVGGVIAPGTGIAEIVPQTDELIIEAKISPIDIDRVSEGQDATIRFSAFKSSVPTIFGRVISISADSLQDRVTGAIYYLARVEVTAEGMEDLGDLILVPGMPADVFIATGSRTFLQYLFKPWSNALARSFIED
ncbi:MAG: HlyD family type I secretion periplasmic adaptor subunit [Pseudohongiellaceae bacterium]